MGHHMTSPGLHPTKFDRVFRGARGGGEIFKMAPISVPQLINTLEADGLGPYGPRPSASKVLMVSTG